MWQFWIDRGGTFTDIVARAPDGMIRTHKLLSENPEQYKDAAVQGIRELLGLEAKASIPAGSIDSVKMGTTVATNALLERKGDRTLLLITKGLGDLLRIGYQNRPRLFDLHIKLPSMLYERVVEVEERIGAQGELVTALDEVRAAQALQEAYDAGIRAVAIAFMHGYRHTDHEAKVANLAREIGFTQVSVSHKVSPLMKLVSRGDTTVVDAYLSPILRRYVDRISTDLNTNPGGGRHRLLFMQSSGGLTDARLFQGKDAILSGPAGGVVGMVETGRIAGFEKLIGFDMGGTSTDVAHFDGAFERAFETEVAGVRMRAPMMNIHTVAAGGGSILHFDGSRYRVGPDSAGANPGPACYRRGGPLAVTDANVMLGKIQPQHFPEVFGPNASEPLDADVVREKFEALASEISRVDAVPRTGQEVAEGFLRIAVENMANAIKKISVQRGYDVTEYTLNCFGGAGGQHACLVADALGMTKVLLHPFAGVLSAYGMGLADIRTIREAQIELSLSDEVIGDLTAHFEKLEKDAVAELSEQGIEAKKIEALRQVHLRYEGTHQPLLVEFTDAETMRQAFDEAHKSRFGFAVPDRKLVVESLSLEAIGKTEAAIEAEVGAADSVDLAPAEHVKMWSEGSWRDVPLYDRANLAPGHVIDGPAIIVEATSTNAIEAGWRAEFNRFGHLILSRVQPRAEREAVGTAVDPVMLEVFNNLFMSIAEQMGVTLANTAYSVNIKERLDFSCALFDSEGALVANAPHVPVHLGSMSDSVRTIARLNEGKTKPGDVFMLNAPFNGGTHLPDVTVITPVFDETDKRILFYVGSRGHHADIGGRTPGSAPPDSRHIDDEGVLIDNWKLVDQGTLREQATRDLLKSGKYPCRNVDQNMADITAQIAANETGAGEIRKMVRHFGLDVVQAYMGHVQDNAEEMVRRVIDVLKDGSFSYPLDSGAKIEVDIRVNKKDRSAVIDFTGTSDQDEKNYNAPLAVTKAAVLYVFRTLVDDEIPLNEGCMKPLDVIAPEGSMINVQYPAAVIAGNTEVSQSITDTLYGALGVIAGSQGTVNNFVYGNDVYQNYETICGGTGAGPDFEGASAVHCHMTNTRMTDPEVLEWRYPVRLEEFRIRPGSGGPGHHTGGDGIVRRLRFLEPMITTVLTSHRITRPFGVDGGEPAAPGRNAVERADGQVDELDGNDETEMKQDDVFVMETPGGGGFGKPPA